MKFRSRMILAYATVALLASLVLGIIVGRTSLQYESRTQKSNLQLSARSWVAQMEENLERMDAIMSYILSDANLLDSITLLRWNQEGDMPDRYVREAEDAIQIGLSTVYIMRNSYRTVFFNQNSFLASSAVYSSDSSGTLNLRLNADFSVDDIPYLEPVIRGNGRSVIVTKHIDPWGAYDSVPVYSLMKALRGEGMGFLEVENRMDSLDLLEKSDPDTCFLILVNGEELLYASEKEYGESFSSEDREMLETLSEGEVRSAGGGIYTKASSGNFDLTVLAYKNSDALMEERSRIFLIAFFAAMMAFAVSLAMIIFWSSILTRPIRRLQEVVESTNIENLQDDRRLENPGGPDEFQELIRSFQTMTARLDVALQNEKKAAMLQLQAQFDTLQTQVNPHFIYNVLNIISSRAVMADDEVICEMCGSLGNMLRYSTNNKERYAPVKKELEYLSHYFYLLKTRYEDRLEVTMDIDGETGEQIIPKMTVQQLVENCVKHGFHHTDVRMHICLTGRVLEDRWILRVEDNGSGVGEEELEELRERLEEVRREIVERSMPAEMEIGGMGLANTYARCLLLYMEDCIFEMENVPYGSGFAVTVGQKRNLKAVKNYSKRAK